MIDSTFNERDIPWLEELVISFSENFQTNNFNKIFQFLVLLGSTLCIRLSVVYIECTKMTIIEFLFIRINSYSRRNIFYAVLTI
ncbi:hypothetical protein ACOSQ4_016109 [Xanthoceras sorbifolium]